MSTKSRDERQDVMPDLSDAGISLSSSDRILLALVSIYFVLKPFYFWPSGLPQPSDFVMAAAVVFFAISRRPAERLLVVRPTINKFFFVFAYYATVVNLTAMLVTGGGSGFIRASFFLLFNAVVGASMVHMHIELGVHLRRSLLSSIAFSALLQAALVLAGQGSSTIRETGQFNNPNQLAYFGLLSASFIIILTLTTQGSSLLSLVGLIASTFLVLESLSKAGIISIAMLLSGLVFMAAFTPGANRKALSVSTGIGIVGIALIGMTTNLVTDTRLFQDLQTRFGADQSDDSLSGRGYSRIWDYPQYWFSGAGEGDFHRMGENIEFHSTIGNLQASYGLIGTVLFLLMLAIAIRSTGYVGIFILGSLMLYGLTHNGIRNTLLWILIALMATPRFSLERSESASHISEGSRIRTTIQPDGVRRAYQNIASEKALP